MSSPTTRQILVLFGVTGNLVRKKIFPALYQLEKQNLLASDLVCFGIGRQEITSNYLLEQAYVEEMDRSVWQRLASKFRYCKLQIDDLFTYASLKEELNQFGQTTEFLFFLAVSTIFFSTITRNLIDSSCWQQGRSFLFLEKPFGEDLSSSNHLQRELENLVENNTIRLIDHYLLKPGIGSLLEVRNLPQVALLWNQQNIHSIQVIATESIGIGRRASFYDRQGQVKDLIQSHLLQILTLASVTEKDEAETRHAFLSSLFLSETCPVQIGQYIEGEIDGELICSYWDEVGVKNESQTATFAAMRFESSLPEWKGVFFEVFTGKRLTKKITEIIVLFHSGERFIIQSAPEICILGCPKESEKACQILEKKWRKRHSGYEAILMSCFSKNDKVFLSPKEGSLGWKALEPYFIKKYPLHRYVSGSWGPAQALTVYASIVEQLKRT